MSSGLCVYVAWEGASCQIQRDLMERFELRLKSERLLAS